MGIKNKATRADAIILDMIIAGRGLMKPPAAPDKNMSGKKVKTMIIVEVTTELKTSLGPLTAASEIFSPRSILLSIFSFTTMELSTKIPRTIIKAIRDIWFISTPNSTRHLQLKLVNSAIKLPTSRGYGIYLTIYDTHYLSYV